MRILKKRRIGYTICIMLNIYQQKNNQHSSEEPSVEESKEKKPRLEAYVDPTGEFGTKEYQLSVWYVKHKVFLYRLLVGSLTVASVFFWGFSLWKWGDWAIFGIDTDRRTEESLLIFPDYTLVNESLKPQVLQVFGTQVLPGGVNKSDLVTEVSNPNPRLKAEFSYYFQLDGEKRTKLREGFVLPGERTLVAELGVENNFGNSSLMIENLVWKRISSRLVPNVTEWQKERLDFTVEDFKFTEAGPTIANANIINFKLRNNTPFGYTEPKFYVALLQAGDSVAAILPLQLTSFKSLEVREIDLRHFVPNLRATQAIVFPQIDLYNRMVYMAPEK